MSTIVNTAMSTTKYFKWLNENRTNYNLTFNLGLNIDSNYKDSDCCGNGIHFTKAKNIIDWFDDSRRYFSILTLPKGANRNCIDTKYKSDKINLEVILDLKEKGVWGKIINYLNIPTDKFLKRFIKNVNIHGSLVLRFLIDNFSDIVGIYNNTTNLHDAVSKVLKDFNFDSLDCLEYDEDTLNEFYETITSYANEHGIIISKVVNDEVWNGIFDYNNSKPNTPNLNLNVDFDKFSDFRKANILKIANMSKSELKNLNIESIINMLTNNINPEDYIGHLCVCDERSEVFSNLNDINSCKLSDIKNSFSNLCIDFIISYDSTSSFPFEGSANTYELVRPITIEEAKYLSGL